LITGNLALNDLTPTSACRSGVAEGAQMRFLNLSCYFLTCFCDYPLLLNQYYKYDIRKTKVTGDTNNLILRLIFSKRIIFDVALPKYFFPPSQDISGV
jgi:hypothetical protein